MTLTKEEKEWNDRYLPCIINPTDSIRNEATKNIITRIKADQNYIFILLEYCLTVPIDNTTFKLALIVITELLKRSPSYFLVNFNGIPERFFHLLNHISESSTSTLNVQRLLGNIITLSFQIVKSLTKEDELSDKCSFYEQIFNMLYENLSTIPLCFYMRKVIFQSSSESKPILFSIISKIITEYYPKEKDFDLLRDCLDLYTTQTSKSNEIKDENGIFQAIYELAVNSENFETDEFNCFWCSIQSINNRVAQPFVEKAFELLQKCENSEIRFTLLSFIEEHTSLVLPEQVEALVNIFYETIYSSRYINPSDFTLIQKLSCVDFDTFGLVYNLINQMYQRGNAIDYFVYILSAFYLLETYRLEFDHVVPEVAENLIKLIEVSFEKNCPGLLLYLLKISSEIMNEYSYIECVKQIPFYLLSLIEPNADQELIKYILLSITVDNPLFNKQELFDKILELFISLHEKIDASTAYFFFYTLSNYLPQGRLFPEDKYQVIHELVQYYIEQKNSNSNEQKDTNSYDYLLSIFIFKMYMIDQQLYSELVEPAIHNLCTSISNIINNDDELINFSETIAYIIIEYLKIFKDEAYQFFQRNSYCSNIFQTIFNNKKHAEIQSYMLVLSHIIKCSRDIFAEKENFSRLVQNNIFNSKDITFEVSVRCAQKYLYLAHGEENYAGLLRNLNILISSSIESKDIERLNLLISIIETIIRPSHVKRHMSLLEDDNAYKDNILPSYVEGMVNIASQLLELCSSSEKNYQLFIETLVVSIFPSLCFYENDIIHEIFKLVFNRLTSAAEDEPIDVTIKNIKNLDNLSEPLTRNKVIQEDEFNFYIEFYQKILADDDYFEVYSEIYVSISNLILFNPEPIMALMPIFNEHWQKNKGDDEYLSILSTLFLMIFVKLSDNFETKQVFDITEEICNRFKPLLTNTDFYIKTSIEFLSKYTDAPISLKEKFLKNFITYLSYQKYCYHIFKVKEDNHQRLIEYLQKTISDLPNAQQIITDCFPDSPRALKGTLEMIGIPYEE